MPGLVVPHGFNGFGVALGGNLSKALLLSASAVGHYLRGSCQ